jgi:hypothetical protein
MAYLGAENADKAQEELSLAIRMSDEDFPGRSDAIAALAKLRH